MPVTTFDINSSARHTLSQARNHNCCNLGTCAMRCIASQLDYGSMRLLWGDFGLFHLSMEGYGGINLQSASHLAAYYAVTSAKQTATTAILSLCLPWSSIQTPSVIDSSIPLQHLTPPLLDRPTLLTWPSLHSVDAAVHMLLTILVEAEVVDFDCPLGF